MRTPKMESIVVQCAHSYSIIMGKEGSIYQQKHKKMQSTAAMGCWVCIDRDRPEWCRHRVMWTELMRRHAASSRFTQFVSWSDRHGHLTGRAGSGGLVAFSDRHVQSSLSVWSQGGFTAVYTNSEMSTCNHSGNDLSWIMCVWQTTQLETFNKTFNLYK